MDLLPAPLAAQYAEGEALPLGPATTLTAGPGTEAVAAWLRAALTAATGLPLPPGAPEGSGIVLALDPVLAAEEYRLTVREGRATIAGGTSAGVFWGAQTLRQLLGPEALRRAPLRREGWALPVGEVRDAPRFGWRGVLLDVSRHFLPKADVLRFLDLMAAHKLNVLHLHLTDDQGWRIEIRRHPRLTEAGAWRERSMVGFRAADRRDDQPHGGYYTQDDLREIVAYAADRQITVVPEIDLPGHAQAAICAYPELGNTDVVDTAALGVWTDWGINPNVLNVSEATLRFFEEVLEEVLELFPSEFVHLGGDECPKDQWKASPAAQARIAELGLKDEEELQSWFIRHFDGWLAARGRRLIGWDEILEGGLAEGAAVSSWRGYEGGIAAAKAGHDVVMCPEQHVYLDHRQAAGEEEPIPVGYVRTLEDVYRFEPVPPELAGTPAAAHVIGTQANLWTEFMNDARDVDYRAFPRLAAFAEVAWSDLPREPAARDWAGFAGRMATHYRRLDALGVEYRHPDGPRPWQRRPGVVGRPID
ncbi:Beta-N-acetylhexosaminidase [Kitasatospora sp. MMS16-BH015]|uniref:beta-N-acetylhexosaminidase n=1 Tax=Kitasatospora sp. MMS16-BH015 TaxID=2018025 RepID=UPI000CA1A000|nr:beta-N-acetylhexosaminidase [Kitasatospora sp. MMS16-BH015]AUG77502.1 Beta-N-acetylhexosaminidase [Kitasatospora sp. MMS16-BH015]